MKQISFGELSIGSWCQIGHAANAEILAKAGFQWIAADCEHGEFEECDIAGFCRAVQQFQCKPLVRVQQNALMPIRRALDLGAAGVIVPLVNTVEEAERAVNAAVYPPSGIRGFAWHRGNNWGVEFESYGKSFDPLLFVMIESKTAVDNVDAIIAVEGVDGCFIGPYDMTGSYGVLGQTEHPAIRNAFDQVAGACNRHNKIAGQHIVTPTREKVEAAVRQGFSFLALGMDSFFLSKGAREMCALVESSQTTQNG